MKKEANRVQIIRREGIYTILILIFFILVFLSIQNSIDILDIKEFVLEFERWIIIAYSLTFLILGLLGVPVSILIIVAGLIFPIKKAIILSIILLNITSIFAFYMARKLRMIKMFNLMFLKHEKVKRVSSIVENELGKRGILHIILMRIFLANIPVSYAAGILPFIRKRSFLIGTIIGNTIFCIGFILLGFSLSENLFLFAVVLIIFLALVSLAYLFYSR